MTIVDREDRELAIACRMLNDNIYWQRFRSLIETHRDYNLQAVMNSDATDEGYRTEQQAKGAFKAFKTLLDAFDSMVEQKLVELEDEDDDDS